jgi:hypothetical protein
MKNNLRSFCAVIIALVSILFAPTLMAQSATKEAYVVQSADKATLTFYYNAERASHSETKWGIDETSGGETGFPYPAWAGSGSEQNTTAKQVVFDASFRDFRPTSTKKWFHYCVALTDIKGMENLNTENVTDMSAMFYCCRSLTSIDLDNFNTEKVENMSAMFMECKKLELLDVSKFNTANVTDMSAMFSFCKSLFYIKVKNFNTEKVTDMKQMFMYANTLTWLDLTNFKTDNVTDMSDMFDGCSNLNSIKLGDFNTTKVTNFFQTFKGCHNLKEIDCNTSWPNVASIRMFDDCGSLKGAVPFDATRTDATMANPETGYFKKISTGVERIIFKKDATQSIYTLDGKRVNSTWQDLPAGVYVVDGKKIIK